MVAVAGRGHSLPMVIVTVTLLVCFLSQSPFPSMSLHLNLIVSPCACQTKLWVLEITAVKLRILKRSSKKLQLSETHDSQVKAQVLHDKRLNNMIGWVTLTNSLLRDHRELPGRRPLCLHSLCGGQGSDCSRFVLWSSQREDISQGATALSAHIPEDHGNLRISALQRDVGVDEVEVALEFLQVLLVF